MKAVDTNIIIRLLTKDDQAQYRLAYALFSHEEIYIPQTVMLETEWVLRFAYKFDSPTINSALTDLCGLANVHVENPAAVKQAIAWHQQGLDFADALHLAHSQSCDQFYSFDQALIKRSTAITSCEVVQPR